MPNDTPESVSPGPATVWIAPRGEEDDAGSAWTTGIAGQWADDLGDAQQDIYTLANGEAIGPA